MTASPGGQFFVAWEDQRNGETSSQDIYGRRIGASGGLLDGTGIQLSQDGAFQNVELDRDPDVAWNGSMFMTVWEAYDIGRDVAWITGYGVRANGTEYYAGLVLGGALGSSRNYDAYQPVLAATGKFFVVAYTWEEPPNGDVNVFAARFDPENVGQPAEIPVAKAPGTQHGPRSPSTASS